MPGHIPTKLRKGQKVRLREDVGCIPAGVYRFLGENELFLSFSACHRAFFGIDKRWSSVCEPVTLTGPESMATSYEDFAARYYALLEKEKGQTFSPEKPVTMCVMAAELLQ